MSKFLQQILKAREPIFSNGLIKLEKSTGNSGIDTRLIADISHKAFSIMRCLGLDVRDTKAIELFNAINQVIKRPEGRALFIDTDYVLIIIDNHVISFNLIDIVENSHHHLPLGGHIFNHGQRALRGELIDRYVSHTLTDEITVKEIASIMGLMSETDSCYNYSRYSKKQHNENNKEKTR